MDKRKITDFTPDPANANKGTERGLRMLDDSLAQSGLGRSIVVDRNGVIIAGNKTTERAIDQGFEDAIVVETDGKQLVVVQRTDLDLLDDPESRARMLAYRDNRSGELDLEWDAEQLLADQQAGVPVEDLFHGDEWEELLYEASLEIIGNDIIGDSVRDANSLHQTNRDVGDGKKVNFTFGEIRCLIDLALYEKLYAFVSQYSGDVSEAISQCLKSL